jgi:hypothetical protein
MQDKRITDVDPRYHRVFSDNSAGVYQSSEISYRINHVKINEKYIQSKYILTNFPLHQ